MKKIVLIICLVGLLSSVGCQNMPEITGNKKTDTAILGGAGGALLGQLIGGDTRSTLIGAAIGAGAGYVLTPSDKKEQVVIPDEFVEVQVTNSNGSVIFVGLKRKGTGYIGPRGEYYPTLPTEDQLRPAYGF